jgi:membrane protein insertase Oxa1/YidC/SpoIIIJ
MSSSSYKSGKNEYEIQPKKKKINEIKKSKEEMMEKKANVEWEKDLNKFDDPFGCNFFSNIFLYHFCCLSLFTFVFHYV